MPNERGLRRRRAGNVEKSAPLGHERTTTSGGRGACGKCLNVTFIIVAALAGYITYAYITAPTSSLIVKQGHDVMKLKWAYRNNSDLQSGVRILSELQGPESIVVDGSGNWYTGLQDGRLVKISNGDKPKPSIHDITKVVPYTAGGRGKLRRPLGLRLVRNQLFVADAHQGIFVIDLKSEKWEKIVGNDDVYPSMAFPDDLAVSQDGNTVYFTDASSRWGYEETLYSLIEGECSGRVFKVSMKTKKLTLICDQLCFPNGVQITRDKSRLLVSENGRKRLLVLDIQSGEVIKTVLLPGGPDNIRPAKSGGYWVAMPVLHDPSTEFMDGYPWIRDIMVGVLGHDRLLNFFDVNQANAVKLNEAAEVVSVHYDREGKVSRLITEVQEYASGKFLLGSVIEHGIVKLDQPKMA